MYTTTNEGLLNNYAVEPEIYYAEYPSQEQQRRYALQGAVGFLFASAVILIALGVS